MKHYLTPLITLLLIPLLSISAAVAGMEKKMVIALKSDNFELAETDISELAIGESRTIETESGKVIDILRTQNGVELYVDGELIDMGMDQHRVHEQHAMQRHVEIICDDDEDCAEQVYIFEDGERFEIESLMDEGGNKIILHKNIEFSCTDGDADSGCADKNVWVSEHSDIDLEVLHEQHQDGGPHKVIVIRKEVVSDQ